MAFYGQMRQELLHLLSVRKAYNAMATAIVWLC